MGSGVGTGLAGAVTYQRAEEQEAGARGQADSCPPPVPTHTLLIREPISTESLLGVQLCTGPWPRGMREAGSRLPHRTLARLGTLPGMLWDGDGLGLEAESSF